MDIYTYSEARQHLSKVLDRAKKAGAVRIRRRGGMVFQVTPLPSSEEKKSPLDVGFVDAKISRKDILASLRESRSKP
jgi:prevent-host-death family protein